MADLIENCRRHRGMIGLLTVLGALLLGARAQQEKLKLVGSDVTLVPNRTGDLREIKWTLNGIILVEIELKPQEEFIHHLPNDRTTINKTNGALTIKYLTKRDSGDYKAKVVLMDNSTQVTEMRLTMRDCPDQPIISVQTIEDQFVVSCKSFSPDITFEWFNQTTSVRKSHFYTEPKKNGTLTCVVDNKVCNKSSSINFYIPAQPEVKLEGDNVTLVPQYTGDPSEVIWKMNGYKLVEMELKPGEDTIFYRLQDRANISRTDGSLTIRDLTMEDYGNYTAVVLVNNNEYYYMEIRLPALKSKDPSVPARSLRSCIILLVLILITIFLWYCCYKNKKCRKKPSTQHEMTTFPQDSDIEGAEESESCITVKFGNDYTSPSVELRGLLEDRLKSPCLTIHGVESGNHEHFTAEAVMSDKEEGTFTEGTETSVNRNVEARYKPNTKHVKELVWKKDGVTLFKWAVSSLKFYGSNINLERESVTVNDAEGKESYIVYFRVKEHPESKSICSITFHPIKMTGKDQITWKKDSKELNTEGGRIKCKPNGDLTIYNATSKDKGKYTVQCIDNELDQEFILHL